MVWWCTPSPVGGGTHALDIGCDVRAVQFQRCDSSSHSATFFLTRPFGRTRRRCEERNKIRRADADAEALGAVFGEKESGGRARYSAAAQVGSVRPFADVSAPLVRSRIGSLLLAFSSILAVVFASNPPLRVNF